ncbi:MAG: hypothetical protein ACN4GG_04245 [Akkermansiaceae bacterium]
MLVRLLLLVGISFSYVSCALVTVPVKVVGKAATTTMDVTGKAVGASISAFSADDTQESEDE